MKRARWIILALLLPLVAWLGGAVLPGCAYDLADGPFKTNFDRRPPEAAFEFTFRRRPPPGVTDLHAAGETWLAGTNVWLRFRTSEQTLKSLLAGYERQTGNRQELLDDQKVWDSTRQRYDPADRLGWKSLYAAPKVECFKQNRGSDSTTVWVDRRTGTVYVFVFGI